MALWPFSKKKDTSTPDQADSFEQVADTEHFAEPEVVVGADFEEDSVENTDFLVSPERTTTPQERMETASYTQPEPQVTFDQELPPDPIHDAVSGESGPFDGDSVDINDFDFSDFGTGILNLGSMMIPLPEGAEVQVEMGPQGPKMLHILTKYGRCTPVAFAAPTTPGQWTESVPEILTGMQGDNLEVEIEQGPWGKEITGSAPGGGGFIRIIGVDGPRWMLRMTLAAPVEHADNMAELGREITARTFVMRGTEPMLAGTPLPVALPAPLAEQVQKEMIRRQEENNNS